MTKESWTHIYGVAGLVPGVVSLALAWKTASPWSEYLLMASGWFAALVYAALLMRTASMSNGYAERCGQSETEYRRLEEKLIDVQKQHEEEMARRASTLDYLAGIAMTRQAAPRVRARKGSQNDN